MKDYDYINEYPLKHHETPAKINNLTGEVVSLKPKKKHSNTVKHDKGTSFKKMYPEAWALAKKHLTKQEYSVAMELAFMAKPFTNSLIPISPDTPAIELAERFNVSRNNVKKIFAKLKLEGVIATFGVGEVENIDSESYLVDYWLFNPYLAFNGTYISKGILSLFQNSRYGKAVKKS